MSKRIVTTVAELDALPEWTVVLGYDGTFPVVAMKPTAADYPKAVPGFWEKVGSEIGTDSETLIWDCGTLEVLHIEDGAQANDSR